MRASYHGFVLLLAAAGCGEPLTPQSEVSKLRVLAIGADRPEAPPGETVTVEALWADPQGEGRDVGFVWTSCTIGPGTDPRDCTEAGAEAALVGLPQIARDGDPVEADVEIPADALDGRDEVVVLVVLLVCAGGLPDLGETDEIVCPDDELVLAYKRITVSRSDAPNANPLIRSVGFGGLDWDDRESIPLVDTCPTGDCPGFEITVVPEPGSAETYVGETPDGEGEIEEELLVSFFSDGGELDRVRAADPANLDFRAAWRAPPEPGDVRFWFVIRDARGGIGWVERIVRALE